MAIDGFKKSIPLVLAHEGGYVDHPNDPGGATNLGITIGTLRAYRGRQVTKEDVKRLTRTEAEAIYHKNYWLPIKGDDLPAGLDYAMFDYAVNSGVSRAVKELQRIVGTNADSVMGLRTLDAARSRGAEGLIDALCNARLAFLKSLRTWPTFGKGWGRRVTGTRAAAKEMARGNAPSLLQSVSPVPEVGAAKAPPEDQKAIATPAGKEATIVATAGGGAALVTGGPALIDLANTLVEQQDELSSGDLWRAAIAIVILLAFGFIAYRQYKHSRARG